MPLSAAQHLPSLRSPVDARVGASSGYLILFFITAYILAWVAFAIPILAARGVLALPMPEAAFLTLATLGIGLAALGVAAAESGRAGMRALAAQVVRWRVQPIWYAVAILGPALFAAGGFLLGVALGNQVPPAPPLEVWLLLASFTLCLAIRAFFVAAAVFDFTARRWLTLIGTVSASGLLVFCMVQAAASLVAKEQFTYFAFKHPHEDSGLRHGQVSTAHAPARISA